MSAAKKKPKRPAVRARNTRQVLAPKQTTPRLVWIVLYGSGGMGLAYETQAAAKKGATFHGDTVHGPYNLAERKRER